MATTFFESLFNQKKEENSNMDNYELISLIASRDDVDLNCSHWTAQAIEEGLDSVPQLANISRTDMVKCMFYGWARTDCYHNALRIICDPINTWTQYEKTVGPTIEQLNDNNAILFSVNDYQHILEECARYHNPTDKLCRVIMNFIINGGINIDWNAALEKAFIRLNNSVFDIIAKHATYVGHVWTTSYMNRVLIYAASLGSIQLCQRAINYGAGNFAAAVTAAQNNGYSQIADFITGAQ